ncbi:MAG TPA: VanZ family protein [Kiritimatiellia bacterium]|nr:VanZ family protein [Kiritimatiellia bacterium]
MSSSTKPVPWFIVVVWTVIIFLTIPFARDIQSFFDRLLGAQIYLVASAIAGGFFSLIVLIYICRKPKRRMVWRIGWLVVILAAATLVMKYQLQTPAEALHFFQYGILSYLFFRAWRNTVKDWIIYPLCTVSVIVVATVDETIQWMMPGRYWDYRDIRLNMLAGVIIQAFIARVIKPSEIKPGYEPHSVRVVAATTLLMLFMLGMTLSNTPVRVDLYATRVPFLHFLSNNESVMSEYGYRHVVPEIGTFYSRFTLDELQQIDAERGSSAGDVIKRYRDFTDYREFLQTFTSSVDPFLHEMRVHLHRRNHYYAAAWQYRDADPARFAFHMTVALRENLILEKYFPRTLAAADSVLSPAELEHMTNFANLDHNYISPVSDHLVTGASEGELWFSILIMSALMLSICFRYGRENTAQTRINTIYSP